VDAVSYLGYDVLELNYNRTGPIEEHSQRKFSILDGGTGKRTSDAHSPAPANVRPFTWTAIGRDEIAELRAFLEARVGMAVPFWLPSFQWDLTLSEDVDEDQTILFVDWVRYYQQMFGETGARRHVALWTLGDGSSMDYYQITDADDPGDEITESVTVSPGAVQDYDAATTVISFLKLCRLGSDLVRISYPSARTAEAVIEVMELPLEAPTG